MHPPPQNSWPRLGLRLLPRAIQRRRRDGATPSSQWVGALHASPRPTWRPPQTGRPHRPPPWRFPPRHRTLGQRTSFYPSIFIIFIIFITTGDYSAIILGDSRTYTRYHSVYFIIASSQITVVRSIDNNYRPRSIPSQILLIQLVFLSSHDGYTCCTLHFPLILRHRLPVNYRTVYKSRRNPGFHDFVM